MQMSDIRVVEQVTHKIILDGTSYEAQISYKDGRLNELKIIPIDYPPLVIVGIRYKAFKELLERVFIEVDKRDG